MNYDDIIDLPHHVSTRHKPMSMINRAAQFAPFSALNGHSEAIEKTELSNAEQYNKENTDLDVSSDCITDFYIDLGNIIDT